MKKKYSLGIWADFTGGINAPLFWTRCQDCGAYVGPFTSISAAQASGAYCRECDQKWTERLRASRPKY